MGNEEYIPAPPLDYPEYSQDIPPSDYAPLPDYPEYPQEIPLAPPDYPPPPDYSEYQQDMSAPPPDYPEYLYRDYYEEPQNQVDEEVNFRYVIDTQTGNVLFDFHGQPLYYDENNNIRDGYGELLLNEYGNPCQLSDLIQSEEQYDVDTEEATSSLNLWGEGDINPIPQISFDEDYEPQNPVTVNSDEVTFVGTDYVTNNQGQTIREDVFALENKDEFYDRLFQNLQADISFSAYTIEQYREEMKSKNPCLMAKLSTNVDTNEQTVNVLAVENDNVVKVPLSQNEKKSLTQLTNEILEMIDKEEEKINHSKRKGTIDYD